MNLLLAIFAADILPIFVIAAIGFVLARHFDVSVRTVSRIVFNALTPALAFTLLSTSKMSSAQFGRMAAFCALVTASIGVIAWLATIPFRLNRPALVGMLLVAMFSNGGNYGLPVALFAFGRDALSYATVYFVTSAVITYTIGVFLAATGRRSLANALTGIVKVPALYGVAAAAPVLMFGLDIPVAVMRPVSLLSDAAIPMMLLVLGMQLERARWPERPALVAVAVAISLFLAPLVALALAWALGLSGPARQAGILEASMPAAVITTILALEFEVAPDFVTSVVFVSTLLSPLTITVLIAYLQRVR